MIGKSVYLLAFLVSVFMVANADGDQLPNKSHHVIIGDRLPGDSFVLKQKVTKNSSWMRVVTVEQTLNDSPHERITKLRALDQQINGNGAYASLLNSGPDANNVTTRFKHLRGHGINFVVELYARS